MLVLAELDLQELNRAFEASSPYGILQWATETFGNELAVVTSFQPTGIVTLHMLSQFAPNTTILTLDTGLLFPETYALMDELDQRLNLNLVRVKPEWTVEQQAEREGDRLWEHNPDACCNLRKVTPLNKALTGYHAWVTGLRRDQSGRAKTPILAWDKKNEKIKVCPFANWTEDLIWMYIQEYDLPYNALHDQNYPSIGCRPESCTQPAANDSNERSGRWMNRGKKECGLHV